MWTIAGGKLTTWRSMAAGLMDQVAKTLGQRRGPDATARRRSRQEPLPGGESPTLAGFQEMAERAGLPSATAAHLVRHYGAETAAILNLIRDQPSLATALHPAHPAVEAEVVHAARRELAARVEDVLARRIHLAWETPDHGVSAADRVAELLAAELGWDEARQAEETQGYHANAAARYGWEPGVALD
jgi:glycerol-3-phosphate dehydrogenase